MLVSVYCFMLYEQNSRTYRIHGVQFVVNTKLTIKEGNIKNKNDGIQISWKINKI